MSLSSVATWFTGSFARYVLSVPPVQLVTAFFAVIVVFGVNFERRVEVGEVLIIAIPERTTIPAITAKNFQFEFLSVFDFGSIEKN